MDAELKELRRLVKDGGVSILRDKGEFVISVTSDGREITRTPKYENALAWARDIEFKVAANNALVPPYSADVDVRGRYTFRREHEVIHITTSREEAMVMLKLLRNTEDDE